MTASKSRSDPPAGPRRWGARRWGVVTAILLALAVVADSPPQHWLRLQSFDLWQWLAPRERASEPAVVVAVDEDSLRAFGQWPWPRTRLAQLVERIAAAEPAAIGIDIFMSEPDRTSPRQVADEARAIDPALADRIAKLPDHDEQLARALAGRQVVLGMGGVHQAAHGSLSRPLASPPLLVRGDAEGLAELVHYAGAVRSLPLIETAAAGHGLLNSEPEGGFVRRLLLLGRVGTTVIPGFGVELLRVASGGDPLILELTARGLDRLQLAGLAVPATRDGFMWLHYRRYEPGRYVSAQAVLEGSVAPERLTGKLVLVAGTGLGLIDQVATPLGETVPGIELHAQLIESLYDQAWLARPAWANWAEGLALLLAGILLSLVVGQARAQRAFAVLVVTLIVLAGASFAAFHAGYLFDAATPVFGSLTTFAIVLGSTLAQSQRQRRDLRGQLQFQRELSARVAGEMEAARRVQIGMLPQAEVALAGEARVAVAAQMRPARAVGGDLYDFFMLDERRLCVLIGDVSGKGLPAAMFMTLVKAHCQAELLRAKGDMPVALAQAEDRIDRENPELMFVTLLALVLDLDSGALSYCNAGHEPACLLRAEDSAVEALDAAGRPPLCALPGHPFATASAQLKPGDTLVMVTDGVTEAMDRAGQLYGHERLRNVLSRGARHAPAEVVKTLGTDIALYEHDVEPADDLAVVVVQWLGSH